jgi:RimJ/RimL family protein N-acetyltransferase
VTVGFRAFVGSEDWAWVCEHNPILRVEDTSGIICYDEITDEKLGAAIFDNWTQNSVQMHVVGNFRAFKHGLMKEFTRYIFNDCDKEVIYAFIPSDNVRSRRLATRMNFTVLAVLKNGYKKGVDYLMVELKKEHCNQLQEVYHG